MNYCYETHLHTKEASACARSYGVEYIAVYKRLGYHGICVTDHFLNGNTAIDRSLSWEEQINGFCLGYERAKEEGDRQGLVVFFGWEHAFFGDEFLIYGLSKEWLLDHPQMMEWDRHTLYDQINRDGGLMIQAHPFRERSYIEQINLHPYSCHGAEIFNSHNEAEANARALFYAKQHQLLMTGGGDIHCIEEAQRLSAGICFPYPIETAADFVRAIKTGRGYSVLQSEKILESVESGPETPLTLHESPMTESVDIIW